jgi:hypothetical protein
MAQTVTELVIDSSGATAGANVFSQAMDSAEKAARGGVDSISALWATVGGAAAVAAVAGIGKFLDKIADANKDLADLNSMARQTGLSLNDLQGFKFGAAVSGLDDSSFNKGLERSASLLNDAQRNVNSLTKLFDENSLSIRGANGQLITQNQLLNTAAELVRRAGSEQDKIKIADMLGFTRQWVPYLEQGANAIGQMATEAQAAGAVIDDETIKKADEFDKAWRRSSTEWSAALKSAALSVLPFIDDLIERAGKIFTKENIKAFAKPGQDAISQGVFGGLAPDKSYDISISDDAKKAMSDYAEGGFSFNKAVTALGLVFSSRGYNVVETNDRPPTEGGEGPFQPFGPFTPAGWKPTTTPEAKTKIPGADQSDDAFDRATQQLDRHTARTEADTKAVGLGAGALAEFRAEAQLTTAALQAGLDPASTKVANKIQDLAQDAGDAAVALEKAKVASQIDFNRQTSLLSSQDVQIASQLKGLYGNDVPAALDSSEAAAIRFNNAMKGISTSVEGNLVTGLADATDGTKSWGDAMNNTKNVVIRSLEEMLIRIAIVQPAMQALQASMSALGFGGGIGGSILSMFGLNPGSALPSTALAGGGYSAPIGPTIGANAAGTDNWRGGLTRVNEQGGEIMDLPAGTRIIPHDVSMAMARGGGQAPVTNVYIQGASSQPSVTQKDNGSGGRDITIDFANAVVDAAASNVMKGGKLADAIASKSQAFGAR